MLVQREFRNPYTGLNHQRVGLSDILIGTIAFAILQKWGEKQTKDELHAAGMEAVVWDMVVVLDTQTEPKGRALLEAPPDEDDEDDSDTPYRRTRRRGASFISASGAGEPFDAFGDGKSFTSAATGATSNSILAQRGHPSEEAFRQAIASQLKPGTGVSLAAESLVQDTVTVDVKGDGDFLALDPPPGFSLVAKEAQSKLDGSTRLTFQRKRKRRRRASFEVQAPIIQDNTPSVVLYDAEMEMSAPSFDGDQVMTDSIDLDALPPLPDDQPSTAAEFSNTTDPDMQSRELPDSTGPILANQKRVRSPLAPRTEDGSPATPHQTGIVSIPSMDEKEDVLEKKDEDHTPVRKSMKKGNSVRKLVDFWSRERPKRATRQHHGSLEQLFHQRRNDFGSANIPLDSPAIYAVQPMAQLPTQPVTESSLVPRRSLSQRHSKNRESVYSVISMASETSMVPYSQFGDDDQPIAARLYRDGSLADQFPAGPLVSTLARFAKFSIASYGSTFLRLTNSWQSDTAAPLMTEDLPQHHTFSSYIRLPSSSILLSSYTDPEGARAAVGDSETGLPLVHYISVDHESRAIVLTCRGTLGFEDVLTDLTGDYDDIEWAGQIHQVHRGVLAAAKRLLKLHGNRVLATLKAALEEFPEYGLITCGHSLGGAVAAVLAVLLAQPNTKSAGGAFKYVTSSQEHGAAEWAALPANRPIHGFAYGPAACFSLSLQNATKGLITTVINGQDAIPFLSLGTLMDFQAMALSFATDSHNAKSEVLRRIKDGLYGAFRDRTGMNAFSGMFDNFHPGEKIDEEDHWPWIALKSLRASMLADKLMPPGEVFIIESQPVLQRHAFVEASSKDKGSSVETRSFRPATHVKLTHVLDVERRFGEMKFGASMFADHFPGRYESILATLNRGLGGGP